MSLTFLQSVKWADETRNGPDANQEIQKAVRHRKHRGYPNYWSIRRSKECGDAS